DITDYAVNHIVDHFSSIDGVARVRIGGALYKSMRVWLKPHELAARGLTQQDVEDALTRENVELPAGEIESENTYLTVRVARKYLTPEAFAGLALSKGESGYVVKLGDVAAIEVGPDEARATMRGNGSPMVSIGIIKQSRSNTLGVADSVKEEMEHLNA